MMTQLPPSLTTLAEQWLHDKAAPEQPIFASWMVNGMGSCAKQVMLAVNSDDDYWRSLRIDAEELNLKPRLEHLGIKDTMCQLDMMVVLTRYIMTHLDGLYKDSGFSPAVIDPHATDKAKWLAIKLPTGAFDYEWDGLVTLLDYADKQPAFKA